MGTPIGLAFFHGWGLDRSFWQPLAALLDAHPHTYFDAGYFGPAQTPDFLGAEHWVAIGHSMGWVHALEHPPAQGWAGMVSLCGFTRFCAQQPGDPGQPKRVVERMARVFAHTPQAVLQDFLARCGLSCALSPLATSTDAWQYPRLLADLSRLADVDVSPLWQNLSAPVLALASKDDVIVPPALTEATFAPHPQTQLIWHAQGGHALGHDRASACALAVQAFLNTLDDGQRTHQP